MPRKKTIVFVQNIAFPQQGAVDIFYYAQYLSKYEDIKVKVIVSKIHENISNNNLEIIELGKIGYVSFIIKAFSQIKKWNKTHTIDYVYFFAQHPFSVILQFFVKYILKIKTIYDVVSGPIGRGILSFIAKITIKLGVFLAEKFIVLDPFLIEKFPLPREKEHAILPMGFDGDVFKENKNADLFNKKNNEIIFTYIGTLNIERKLDIFVQAFIANIAKNPDIKLYFIGSGTGEKLLQEAAGSYLGINIFFLGSKPHNTIPDYINSSDIMISYVPKVDYFEYQPPTKLIEYLACNKPVMATNTIAQEEILSGYGYMLHKDDFTSTKEKISYFIEHIRDIQENKFSKIVQKYRWEKLVQGIRKLLFS